MIYPEAIGTQATPPRLCAVSGKPVYEQSTIRYHLTADFYVVVLPKYQAQLTEETRAEYRASIEIETPKRGKDK